MKMLSMLALVVSSCALGGGGKPATFVEPALINGRPANPAEFPASVYVNTGGGRCTGTVVGPRVLLIAAHCMPSGAVVNFSVGPNHYRAVCTHSKDYASNATADYALCKTETVVSGIHYENVTLDDKLLKVGDELLLTGYGCTQPGGKGGNDGIYRIGEATITGLPTGSSNDITTRRGGALCFGDSGGPAFKYLDTAKSKRVVVSVNSRGDIATTSYLSALYSPQGKRFVGAWLEKNPGMQICGVSEGTLNCRADLDQPPAPPPVEPKSCVKEFEVFKTCFEGGK